jgi:hypothetical protein
MWKEVVVVDFIPELAWRNSEKAQETRGTGTGGRLAAAWTGDVPNTKWQC